MWRHWRGRPSRRQEAASDLWDESTRTRVSIACRCRPIQAGGSVAEQCLLSSSLPHIASHYHCKPRSFSQWPLPAAAVVSFRRRPGAAQAVNAKISNRDAQPRRLAASSSLTRHINSISRVPALYRVSARSSTPLSLHQPADKLRNTTFSLYAPIHCSFKPMPL